MLFAYTYLWSDDVDFTGPVLRPLRPNTKRR